MKTVNISTQKIRNKLRALSEEVSSFDSAWLVLYKIENWLTNIEEDKEDNNSHWKPSEEQMEALARATNRCVGVDDAKILIKLLEQLEKL